jgi:ribosome-associated protein
MHQDAPILPSRALEERFVRASGPGGQNVNKVSTAVELRVHVASLFLREDVDARLRTIAGRRINQDGVLVIQAQTFRTQDRNRQAAKQRLAEFLKEAVKPPPPKRRPTKPSRAAKAARVDAKVHRGAIKAGRQNKPRGDD